MAINTRETIRGRQQGAVSKSADGAARLETAAHPGSKEQRIGGPPGWCRTSSAVGGGGGGGQLESPSASRRADIRCAAGAAGGGDAPGEHAATQHYHQCTACRLRCVLCAVRCAECALPAVGVVSVLFALKALCCSLRGPCLVCCFVPTWRWRPPRPRAGAPGRVAPSDAAASAASSRSASRALHAGARRRPQHPVREVSRKL